MKIQTCWIYWTMFLFFFGNAISQVPHNNQHSNIVNDQQQEQQSIKNNHQNNLEIDDHIHYHSRKTDVQDSKLTKDDLRAYNNCPFYKILEVKPNAYKSEIRHAYKDLAMKWHPAAPHNNENILESEAMFINLGLAYFVLTDKRKRRLCNLGTGKAFNSFSFGRPFSHDVMGDFNVQNLSDSHYQAAHHIFTEVFKKENPFTEFYAPLTSVPDPLSNPRSAVDTNRFNEIWRDLLNQGHAHFTKIETKTHEGKVVETRFQSSKAHRENGKIITTTSYTTTHYGHSHVIHEVQEQIDPFSNGQPDLEQKDEESNPPEEKSYIHHELPPETTFEHVKNYGILQHNHDHDHDNEHDHDHDHEKNIDLSVDDSKSKDSSWSVIDNIMNFAAVFQSK